MMRLYEFVLSVIFIGTAIYIGNIIYETTDEKFKDNMKNLNLQITIPRLDDKKYDTSDMNVITDTYAGPLYESDIFEQLSNTYLEIKIFSDLKSAMSKNYQTLKGFQISDKYCNIKLRIQKEDIKSTDFILNITI